MVHTLYTEEPVFSGNLSATGTYTGHGRSAVSRLYSVVHTNFKHELHDQSWVKNGKEGLCTLVVLSIHNNNAAVQERTTPCKN